jgi:replicative superfamily II helicase
MARFLIELTHEANEEACTTAIQTLLSTGSHFLTNAEWGCKDGEHRCWIIVDVNSLQEARAILPPVYRHEAKIIKLIRYSLDDLNEALETKEY